MNEEKVTQLMEAMADLICKLPINEVDRLRDEVGIVLSCMDSLDE